MLLLLQQLHNKTDNDSNSVDANIINNRNYTHLLGLV